MIDRIEKTAVLNAPVDRVWRALTDHREFGTWFGAKIDAPFAAGQTARGHITYPGFEHVVFEVVIACLEPPRRFAFTWHPYAIDPTVDYTGETPTRVEFTLEPEGSGTRLTVVETGFAALPPARRPDALRMNDSGWAEQLRNIAAHVDG